MAEDSKVNIVYESKGAKKVADDAKNVEKSLTELAKTLGSLASLSYVFKTLMGGALSFAKQGEELDFMARSAGVSAQNIEKLGHALSNYGGSASSASATLAKLNQQMQELYLSKGGKLGQIALKYGIDLSAKTPEEMLINIARRMEGMSALKQLSFGRALGLDNATLMFLQTGVKNVREELEKASKFSLYSEQDIKNAKELQKAYREQSLWLDKIFAIIKRGLVPVFTRLLGMLNRVLEFFAENPKYVKIFFATFIAGLTAVSFFLSPVLTLLGLLSVGLLALIDDFAAFEKGQKSLLPWKEITTTWRFVQDFFTGFIDGITDGFEDAFDKLLNLYKLAVEFWDWITGKNKKSVSSGSISNEVLGNKQKSLYDTLNDTIYPESMAIGKGYLTNVDGTPLNSINSGVLQATYNNSNNTNKPISIDTVNLTTQAKDPQSVMDYLTNELGATAANFGEGY